MTLTTRVTEMLDVLQRLLRPLRRFGVDPDRVGLVLALTIRCIPLLVGIVRERLRGEKGARRWAFRSAPWPRPPSSGPCAAADAMGDALIARGVDD